MSVEYITRVRKVKTKPVPKYILLVLANYADSDGYSYPSHETIADWTCLSLTAVKANLKKLKEEGLLTWERRNNTSNLYRITIGRETPTQSTGDDHNTKVHTKKVYILDLEKINEIYKSICDKTFYQHSANTFKAEPRWKELKELGRKGVISPKTGKKINLATEEFWIKYFEIANSDGHKKWIRSYWDKKPTLMTMLGLNQFDAIIERKYG
tara:strand:- start:267 stop:899 length:633 start_codon:yes stop_codon:yes gene_type:complete